MWKKLRRFSDLDAHARGVFLRAAVALPMIAQSLRRRGFRATRKTLLRLSGLGSRAPGDPQCAAVTARMVRVAARHCLCRPSCLEESLTLWWLLARQGIDSEIRIGVRKDSLSFAAHAWVESAGVALNEPDGRHRHYAAFDSEFPPALLERR